MHQPGRPGDGGPSREHPDAEGVEEVVRGEAEVRHPLRSRRQVERRESAEASERADRTDQGFSEDRGHQSGADHRRPFPNTSRSADRHARDDNRPGTDHQRQWVTRNRREQDQTSADQPSATDGPEPEERTPPDSTTSSSRARVPAGRTRRTRRTEAR